MEGDWCIPRCTYSRRLKDSLHDQCEWGFFELSTIDLDHPHVRIYIAEAHSKHVLHPTLRGAVLGTCSDVTTDYLVVKQ